MKRSLVLHVQWNPRPDCRRGPPPFSTFCRNGDEHWACFTSRTLSAVKRCKGLRTAGGDHGWSLIPGSQYYG
jgi:hypothetical protein